MFESITAEGLSLQTYLICAAVALVCGVIAAAAAAFRTKVSKSFLISVVILSPIVMTVILMVNGSIGTGIAIAGAFSLVRFRSAQGKARDIAVIFLSMTAGLTCAIGYIWLALLFTALISVVLLLCSFIPMRGENEYDLRITVPETLHFSNAFDDLFEKYTKSHQRVSVKTSNMGSLYKLHYKITLKTGASEQELMDEIRCRNGNLEVSIGETGERSEDL